MGQGIPWPATRPGALLVAGLCVATAVGCTSNPTPYPGEPDGYGAPTDTTRPETPPTDDLDAAVGAEDDATDPSQAHGDVAPDAGDGGPPEVDDGDVGVLGDVGAAGDAEARDGGRWRGPPAGEAVDER